MACRNFAALVGGLRLSRIVSGMKIDANLDLPKLLAERLSQITSSSTIYNRFAPELCYGRHQGPPAHDHRRAAVLILCYPHQEQWYLPLTVRPAHLSTHGGQISLPGGMLEPGESTSQAACRELQEELGLCCDQVQPVGQLPGAYIYVSNFWVTPWVATIHSKPQWKPSADEVAEVIELPLSALANSSNYGSHTITRRGLTFNAPHIRWQGHQIWGATSMILFELIKAITTPAD